MIDKKITVIVHTLNEENNIENCLRCLLWADQLLVVDMHSDDRTVEIAKKFPVEIISVERRGYVEPARELAVTLAKNDWILIVDADELIPRSLVERLKEVAASENYDAIKIPRLNFMFGEVVSHTGWDPYTDAQLRFFRKGSLIFSPVIHHGTQVKDGARLLVLRDDGDFIVHFNYIDAEQFISKLNRYTTIEARKIVDSRKPIGAGKFFWTCAKTFIDRYFRRSGWRDGLTGFYLSLLMMMYVASSMFKARLMGKFGPDVEQAILTKYAEVSRKVESEGYFERT